mgnify:CR=1 FL=1
MEKCYSYKVTPITFIRNVHVNKKGEIEIFPIAFCCGECISTLDSSSHTLLEISYNEMEPHFYSGGDDIPILGTFPFLGEVKTKWKNENFILQLSSDYVESKETATKAIMCSDKIYECIELNYKFRSQDYIRYMGIHPIDMEKLKETERKLDELWNELKEADLVRGNVLLKPEFLFIVPDEIKETWSEQQDDFGELIQGSSPAKEWITPNVFKIAKIEPSKKSEMIRLMEI